MKDKHAVVVTDIAFWNPGVGSHSRIEQTCRILSNEYKLTVFVYKTLNKTARDAINKKEYPYDIVSYKHFEAIGKESRNTGDDLYILEANEHLRSWFFPSWKWAFDQFLSREDVDIVVVQYVRLHYLIKNISPNIVTVLDAHDVMSQRAISFFSYNQRPSIFLTLANEQAIMLEFDFVLAISKNDYLWICKHIGRSKSLYIPFDCQTFSSPEPSRKCNRLIFAGANSEANRLGLAWFVDYVWPYVRGEYVLEIFGSVQSSYIYDDKIIQHGVVDDILQIYKNFGIVINPVFFGGGLKIKSLEAISAGFPLVVSSEGIRGLEEFEQMAVFICKSRADYIDTLKKIAKTTWSWEAIQETRSSKMREYKNMAEGHAQLKLISRMHNAKSTYRQVVK